MTQRDVTSRDLMCCDTFVIEECQLFLIQLHWMSFRFNQLDQVCFYGNFCHCHRIMVMLQHPQLLRKITEADSFGSSRDSIVSAIEQEDDHLSIQYQSQEEFLRQQQVPEDVYMVSVGTQCTPIPPPRKFGIAHQVTKNIFSSYTTKSEH